ncbi:MAG: DUF4397 domain-containing protein [Pseudomonadales bacterium]|nr:DUF4397 domain-containing protein [Pseudomonadales bacterium]
MRTLCTSGRAIALTGIVIVSLLLTSCGKDEGFTEVNVPTGYLRVVHTISDAPSLQFIVDERPEVNLSYGESSGFINALPELPILVQVVYYQERQPVIVASMEVTIQQDHDFTIVASGTLDNPRLTTIDNPMPEFEAENTTAEIQFVHAASGTPDALTFSAGQSATTTLGPGDTGELVTLAGDSEVNLDVSDAAANSLWSTTTTLGPSTRTLLVLIDYFGPGGGDVRLIRVTGSGAGLFPSDYPSAIRVANMIPDRGALDVTLDGTITLADAIAFGNAGGDSYVNVPAGEHTIRVTLAGQPDNIIHEVSYLITGGNYRTLTMTGLADSISSRMSTDDHRWRQVQVRSMMNVTHASPSANPEHTSNAVDVYFLSGAETVAGRPPNAILGILDTSQLIMPEGTYDLVVTNQGSEDVLFGPQRIDFGPGGLYRIFLTDTTGGGTPMEIILSDGFVTQPAGLSNTL